MERKLVFQIACVVLLFFSHLHLSYDFYGAWWYSAMGFCLITFFGHLIWGRQFFTVSGLKVSPVIVVRIILLALCVTGVSAVLMSLMADQSRVLITYNSFESYVHDVFYIVNEEMILGSVMLYFLTGRFRMKPWTASVALAFVIAVAHFICYRWYFRDKGFLDLTTLVTLFLTAVLKNNLILRYRHIGYAWAVHFGWMTVMFGSEHYHLDGSKLADLEKFDLYLGSWGILLLSALLAGLSIRLLAEREKANRGQ